MRKFEDMNIIAALDTIMRVHTKHYQNDFDIDRKIITRAAQSENPEDKNLLWMSRPAGTHCHSERDVFIKDTYAHNSWIFYGEQTRDRILAYAVEITGVKDGKVWGSLYELDYGKHFVHIRDKALPVDKVIFTFKDGGALELPYRAGMSFPYQEKPAASVRYEPANLEAWKAAWYGEQIDRRAARAGNYLTHITLLDKMEAKPSVKEKLQQAQQAVKDSPKKSTPPKDKGTVL